MVTEQPQYSVVVCIFSTAQNTEISLIPNGLHFIFTYLQLLALAITLHSARHSYASQLYHANVPIGLIAQNMGRNTSEIETYLKEFNVNSIVSANNKSLIVGQDLFKEMAKKQEKERQDNIRKVLMANGNVEELERYEAYLKWREEH